MKILLYTLSLLMFISCGDTADKKEITEFDEIGFFNIVYETLAVRQLGTTSWTNIEGDRDIKFQTETSIEENEELPDIVLGNFTFKLVEYTRSSSISRCSGNYSGTFALDLFQKGETSDAPQQEDLPYSIYDPYDPDNGTETPIDPDDVVDTIKTFYFSLKVDTDSISLYPQEVCDRPFQEYIIKVVRFPNGTITLDDESMGLQYFLRPKLRVER